MQEGISPGSKDALHMVAHRKLAEKKKGSWENSMILTTADSMKDIWDPQKWVTLLSSSSEIPGMGQANFALYHY